MAMRWTTLLIVLFELSSSYGALPPMSGDSLMSQSSHVFSGTVMKYTSARLLTFGRENREIWRGTDIESDPSKLDAFELGAGQVDRTSGHVWETEAVISVDEWFKGGPGPTHTVRYRNVALPQGMVGGTGQHTSPKMGGERYMFYVTRAGNLIEPNGCEREASLSASKASKLREQRVEPPKVQPVPLEDEDGVSTSFSPPKLKHSRRGGFMGGEKLVLTRAVTQDECPWLDGDLTQGQHVWVYRGHTYGVVGPSGLAVSHAPPEEEGAFFELPRDAVALHES